MPTPRNQGKPWTPAADAQLRKEAGGNTPTRVIGIHMGRSEQSIRSRASDLGVSLKPTNQSPYGTKQGRRRAARKVARRQPSAEAGTV